jgi:DNA polymerase-3 subunit chi
VAVRVTVVVTRIDFYILQNGGAGDHEAVSCRLVEKAYKLGMNVYIHTDSTEQARRIDELLWSFRAGSFLPHALHPPKDDDDVPVRIGSGDQPWDCAQVLINLSATVPLFFSRFERVVEVVVPGETGKAQGRDRYRFYRDRGYPLQSHNLPG